MTAKLIQSIKGMNDILPSQIPHWQRLETTVQRVFARYGYQEIRFPIVEQTALFVRTIGKATDIVEKEMYTFDDNGESLTLRPEGTAGCVRAVIEAGWLRHNPISRLWYCGPMFRHENPQKGRYRQFYQFGIEAFGLQGPDIDAEQIFMVSRIWHELGLQDMIQLQINSLGSSASRQQHRQALVDYFTQHRAQLDADSQRRLTTNPLRILDSKNPDMQKLIEGAPQLLNFLDENSRAHFAEFCRLLDLAKISYTINPRLVRGLDYYGYTVYEWVTTKLGAQGTVCAGGRYDALVEQLGGPPTPAVGFAMGLERIVALSELAHQLQHTVDAYFVLVGKEAEQRGMILAEQLRQQLPQLKLIVNCGGGNFKTQFKRADKSGAKWALILGDEELANNKIALKDLRQEASQFSYEMAELIKILRAGLESADSMTECCERSL